MKAIRHINRIAKTIPRKNFVVACGPYNAKRHGKCWIFVIVYLTKKPNYIEISYSKIGTSVIECLTPREFIGRKYAALVRHFKLEWMTKLITSNAAFIIYPECIFKVYQQSQGMIKNI
jgi:hypothetical protein